MEKFKIKKQFIVLLGGIVISGSCFAQEDSTGNLIMKEHTLMPTPAPSEEIFYKGSVQVAGGEEIPLFNKALRVSLSGVYNMHFSGNYVLAPHIFAGVELEDVQLGNAFVNAPYSTLMTMYNVGVKMGYYTYMQNDFLFCYSLSAGPSIIIYSDAPNPAPKGGFREQSFFISPDIFAGYRVNDELRVGIDFSVLVLAYRFDPATTGIDQYVEGSYNPGTDTHALTTCIGVGFGFYWAFAEGKK